MLARSFLIESSSKLLVTRTGIKARSSSILGRISPLILELLALKWRKFYTFEFEYLWSQLGKNEYNSFSFFFLAHLSRRLTRWAYSIPMVRRRRPHFQTWISLKPDGQSWSNFMCSITGVGERLHTVLGQIGSNLWFPWQQKAPIDL